MINMLIVKSNISHLINLSNYITSSIPKIRLYGLASTGFQTLDFIKTSQIDLILLDSNLPDCSTLNILNQIASVNSPHYKKSIILISNDINLISKVHNHSCVYDTFYNYSCIDLILEKVNFFIEYKESQIQNDLIKNKIIQELKNLNYNFSYNGTKYLIDCIYEAYKFSDIYNINLTKNIYPIIAKKYNKSINNVKCNIVQSTNSMYFDCKEQIIKTYFYDTSKPTVKRIIFTILNKL